MVDKIRALIDLMNDESRKDVSAYKVWTQTGISQATLSDLKSGKKEISSLSINNGQKLVDYYNKLEENKMTKLITWTGRTTDKRTKYTAEGESYEELYSAIQDKYGYDSIIDRDAFELKTLEVNGEDVEEFLIDDELDYEKYQEWESPQKLDNVTEEHYFEIINDSTSQAYYHEFETE